MSEQTSDGIRRASSAIIPPERITAFTDGVVAIAMTLLIMPLMESVAGAAGSGQGAAAWLAAHEEQIQSFLISFILIAVFWLEHRAIFDRVRGYTRAMVWLNVLWTLTIVWLPVPTAMIGTMRLHGPDGYDRVLVALYIGSLMMNAIALAAVQLAILRSPRVWRDEARPTLRGLFASVAFILLALLALVLALTVQESMAPIFLLVLVQPLAWLLRRLVDRRGGRAARRAAAAETPGGSGEPNESSSRAD